MDNDLDLVDIYFLSDGESIKIGYSKRIDSRQETLQVANSNKLILVGKITRVPKMFEKHIHSICSSYHIQGEWFKKEALYNHLLNHIYYREKIKLEKVKENEGFI